MVVVHNPAIIKRGFNDLQVAKHGVRPYLWSAEPKCEKSFTHYDIRDRKFDKPTSSMVELE